MTTKDFHSVVLDPIILLILNQQSLSQIMTLFFPQNLPNRLYQQYPTSKFHHSTLDHTSLSLSLSLYIIVISKNKTHLALQFILKTFKICVIHDLCQANPPTSKYENTKPYLNHKNKIKLHNPIQIMVSKDCLLPCSHKNNKHIEESKNAKLQQHPQAQSCHVFL